MALSLPVPPLADVARRLKLILAAALGLSAAVLAGAAVVQLLGHGQEAVRFTLGLLAVVGLGPVAGAAALALDRPRTVVALAFGPGLVAGIVLLASG